MLHSFTGSLGVAEAGARREWRCWWARWVGYAWGIIDALPAWRTRDAGWALQSIPQARSTGWRGEVIAGSALPTVVTSVLEPMEAMRQRMTSCQPSGAAHLEKDNWQGALGVFLLVFFSTLPVAIPYPLVRDAHTALRISNGIAVACCCIVRVCRPDPV